LRTEIWIDYAITPGDYWLRLDMEFPFIAWGSGLHPQNNPNNPLWPPQDIHIYVEKQQPDPPNPGVTSGHSYGSSNTTWSPDDTVAMSWSAVSDRLLDYYKVCWNQRNGGQDGCHNNGTNTSFSRTLSNGIYDFELTTMTDDNTPSNPAIIENIRIDVTDPTAELDPLPIRVQAPDYVLEWNSGDTGGSGFVAQQLTYQINNDGNWRSVPAVSNDLGMRSIRFYFPEGQHGDVYEFCLTTRDGAGNSSVSCDSTTFNPDPDLYVEPLKLTWQTVYSNTLPNTQTLTIENYGGVVLNWSITTPFTLATVGQTTGTAPSIVPVVLTHPVGITATYQGYITVTGTTPGTRNSPKIVEVIIYVRERDNTLYFPIIFKQ
ncbi:MAG: hypothetical protein GY943_26780, partial [Chloroflexi bacterium]|nr:hypothetical protein [Chloroflexota bacterium]